MELFVLFEIMGGDSSSSLSLTFNVVDCRNLAPKNHNIRMDDKENDQNEQ